MKKHVALTFETDQLDNNPDTEKNGENFLNWLFNTIAEDIAKGPLGSMAFSIVGLTLDALSTAFSFQGSDKSGGTTSGVSTDDSTPGWALYGNMTVTGLILFIFCYFTLLTCKSSTQRTDKKLPTAFKKKHTDRATVFSAATFCVNATSYYISTQKIHPVITMIGIAAGAASQLSYIPVDIAALLTTLIKDEEAGRSKSSRSWYKLTNTTLHGLLLPTKAIKLITGGKDFGKVVTIVSAGRRLSVIIHAIIQGRVAQKKTITLEFEDTNDKGSDLLLDVEDNDHREDTNL